jgi:hypothetical protein
VIGALSAVVPAEDPNRFIIAQQVPPAKPAPVAPGKPGVPTPPGRSYYGTTRSSQPVYLLATPGGTGRLQLPIGLVVSVRERGPQHSKIETDGLIRVTGWVPTPVLGLRVKKNTQVLSAPGGKRFGEVAAGTLVHVAQVQGAHAKVVFTGYLPLEAWVLRQDLTTAPTSYASLSGRYPGGSLMVVSEGPLHAGPDGAVVARALDEGRVYRVSVVGQWSQIAMYDYSRVGIMVWVPTSRLRWGGYPWFGTGYNNHNCKPGTSGNMVALTRFRLYAEPDDAWPSIVVEPTARFNVQADRRGWVRVLGDSCLQFTAYAEDRPGDFTSAR